MQYKPFRQSEVEQGDGWIVDLSPANIVNPDCYWRFATKRAAESFAGLIDSGMDAQEAAHIVEQRSSAAASLGKSTSDAKAAAARANGKRGGRPKATE